MTKMSQENTQNLSKFLLLNIFIVFTKCVERRRVHIIIMFDANEIESFVSKQLPIESSLNTDASITCYLFTLTYMYFVFCTCAMCVYAFE